MSVWILAFLAHFLGDYPLQGDFLANWKSKSFYILFVHCFIWTGLVSLALIPFELYALWKFLFLLTCHFIIDAWKCRTFSSPEEIKSFLRIEMSGMEAFFLDQFLHAFQIAVVILF